ncbi:nitrite reductase (NAD(P)H) small subunit [Brachybacterium sp. DNPG3]
MNEEDRMIDVCALEDLMPERGAGAILGERQVALFRLADGSVRAVQQHDPYSAANVLSRGIVGSHGANASAGADADADASTEGAVPTLTSPMYKQVWSLDTGEVLDAAGGEKHDLAVFDVAIREGRVLVSPTPRPAVAVAASPEVGA